MQESTPKAEEHEIKRQNPAARDAARIQQTVIDNNGLELHDMTQNKVRTHAHARTQSEMMDSSPMT